MKTCNKCKKDLSIDEFGTDRSLKSGVASICLPCTRLKNRQYRESKDVTEYDRKRNLVRRYGITDEQYQEKLAAQGGVCAVCKKTNPGGHRLAVDHDHETGKVRDLLCHNCNRALGHAQDDSATLLALYNYRLAHE